MARSEKQPGTKSETNPQPQQVQSYQRRDDRPGAITPIEYSGLQEAFDHFNGALFEGSLPDGSPAASTSPATTSSRSTRMGSSIKPTSRFAKPWCMR